MRHKKLTLGLVGGMLLYAMSMIVAPATIGTTEGIVVEAQDLGDDLSGSSSSDGEKTKDNGVNGLLKGYEGMTSEQLAESSEKVSPITNIFGYVMGAVIALTAGGIFVITVLDLAYIAIPPVRAILYKGGQQAGGGAMMGGYGRPGYGGMGGGYGGAQQQPQGHSFQLISDEAVQCAVLLGGAQQQPPMGGGMMGMQQQPQNMPTKSVIMTYFKKRIFFMIIFAICTSMLTTSLFLGTGINLAQWFTKLVEMINGSIPK